RNMQSLHVIDREHACRPRFSSDRGHLSDELAGTADPHYSTPPDTCWATLLVDDDLRVALLDQQHEVRGLVLPHEDASGGKPDEAAHLFKSGLFVLQEGNIQLVRVGSIHVRKC